MALKVCLIKPPSLLAPKSLSYHGSCPPLGLAYIAAIVRKQGYGLQVIDAVGEAINQFGPYDNLLAHGLTVEEIVDKIEPDTDVVGITNMFLHEFYLLKDISSAVKKRFPQVKIVAGGENASSAWNYILSKIPDVDYLIRGEGEFKMLDLLHALENNIPTEEIEGLAYIKNGKPFKNGLGNRLVEVNEIPWPAWDLFPVEAYINESHSSGINRGRSMPMITSRGCPYQCKFCSAPEMWTTKYVAREPEDVVKEIEHYIERYGISNIDLNDLTSVLTKKWIKAFCESILEKNIKITWQLPQGSRSEVIDEESAELLYKSGCRNYLFAPESGSERMIAMMKKNLKLPNLLQAMRIAKSKKMIVGANFIVGLPDETFKDFLKTYWFVIRCIFAGIDEISVMIFGPYPGSFYYNRLVEEGKITFDKTYVYSSLLRVAFKVHSYNSNFKAWQLVAMQLSTILTFWCFAYVVRPWRLYYLVRNLISNKHERIIDKLLFIKLRQFKSLYQSKPALKPSE